MVADDRLFLTEEPMIIVNYPSSLPQGYMRTQADAPINVVFLGIFRKTKGLWIFSKTHDKPKLILLKALDTNIKEHELDINNSCFPFTVWEGIQSGEQIEIIETFSRSRFEIMK